MLNYLVICLCVYPIWSFISADLAQQVQGILPVGPRSQLLTLADSWNRIPSVSWLSSKQETASATASRSGIRVSQRIWVSVYYMSNNLYHFYIFIKLNIFIFAQFLYHILFHHLCNSTNISLSIIPAIPLIYLFLFLQFNQLFFFYYYLQYHSFKYFIIMILYVW
jgi:hypothetical protein